METQKLQTLVSLFNQKVLRIPDYQRGYSWTVAKESKQLKDLWNDLMNIDNSFHFTGVIVLDRISEKNKARWREFDLTHELKVKFQNETFTPFFIIDGQQRLVSLVILLFLLSQDNDIKSFRGRDQEILETYIKKNSNDESIYLFGYEKDTPSHEYLLGRIFEDAQIEVTEPDTLYTRNLNFAKSFFENRLKTLDGSEKKQLYKNITEKLLFNVLEIENEKLDISLIFETLNYRGKSLSKLELFKNRLIYLVTKKYGMAESNSYRAQIVHTWLDIYEWLGKNQNAPLDDDEFLRSFWIMFYKHDERPNKEFKNFEKDIFEEKYNIVNLDKNEYLRSYGPSNLDKLLDNLSIAVKYWFFIHNPDSKTGDFFRNGAFTFSENIRALLNKLLRNNYGTFMRPLILAYLINYGREYEHHHYIETVLSAIERHNYCVYYFSGCKSDTNRADIYRSINQFFRGEKGPDEVDYMIRNSTDKWLKWKNVYENIHQSRADNKKFFSWEGLDYTMIEWEASLQANQTKLLSKKPETYLIFDITPSHRGSGTYVDVYKTRHRESLEKLQLSLGNILIGKSKRVTNDFNKLLQNLSDGIYSEKDLASRYHQWSDSNILDRGLKILHFIEKKWDICYNDLKDAELEEKREKLLLDGVIVD